jgi:hypothetical protein
LDDIRPWSIATKNGHFEILKWLLDKEWSIDYRNIYSDAIEGGQFEILKWLVDNKKYSINEGDAYILSVENGYL